MVYSTSAGHEKRRRDGVGGGRPRLASASPAPHLLCKEDPACSHASALHFAKQGYYSAQRGRSALTVDDGLLDGEHVVFDVRVHQRVQQLLPVLAGARHVELGADGGGGLGGGGHRDLDGGLHSRQVAVRHLGALCRRHPKGVLEGAAAAADVGAHNIQTQVGEGGGQAVKQAYGRGASSRWTT